MLARYIRVICGETLLSWEELRRFCSLGLKRLSPRATLAVPPQVIWLTQHALSARQFTYPSLLHTFGTSGCENPRDKVYALQGIVQREDRPIVHYESSVDAVFKDAAMVMIRTAVRESKVRNAADLSRINYKGSIQDVFLDAAKLWMKELEGVIHLEMMDALIVLRKEMGLCPLVESSAERSRLLEAVRAIWSHLAHFHLRLFLVKHQSQSVGTNDFKNDDPSDMSLSSGHSETLTVQLRHHYDALVNIFRTMQELIQPEPAKNDQLYYPEKVLSPFGKPWYCDWLCSHPAIVHIIP
jgi:hypothetical protein